MSPSLALVRVKHQKTSADDKWDRLELPEALPGQALTVGRELDCHFRIKMIDVSRRHARLESSLGQWHVTDLQSTNGLFINGKQLAPLTPHPLKIGDKLSFGPPIRSELVYQLIDTNSENSKRKLSFTESEDSLEARQLCAKRPRRKLEDLFDLELSCSICSELFISPVNLNCSHTFCESCIEQWKRVLNMRRKHEDTDDEKESELNCCPICRQPIVSQSRVLALENVIDYLLKNWWPNMLERRKRLTKERSGCAMSA